MSPISTQTVDNRPRWRRSRWLFLLLVWSISALYAASLLKRGWVPHDEGTLGQSAERVLAGELPHRDFDDVYTGGLSYLNAGTFRVLGRNLLAPRIALFAVFLCWIPVVYIIASRFASIQAAAAVTLLAAAWSIPNYSAAIPSWYNLFLGTFGLAAALRYMDTQHSGWLFLAGLYGGISFLFKLSGLYFIAAVLLFLVFREQEFARFEPHARKWSLYSSFVVIVVIAFIAAIGIVVRHNLSTVVVVEFVLPSVALALLCVRRELGGTTIRSGRRFVALGKMVLPFALGAALPVAIFLVPYLRSGAVSDFIYGVFVLPGQRFEFASRRPPGFGLNRIVGAIVLAGLLIVAYRGRDRSWMMRLIVLAALIAVFYTSKTHPHVFTAAWAPLALLLPEAALTAALLLASRGRAALISPLRQQELFLLVAVAAVCSLIQLPFPVGIYFCYAVPFIALALAVLFSTSEHPSLFLLGSLSAFYIAFVIFRVTPGFIYTMGNNYQPDPQTQVLNLARAGGLHVAPKEAREYEQLIFLVQEHAGGSEFIYAGPDCPEVYFLAGKRNPTRMLYDFFDQPHGHTRRILEAIESHNVKVVAILKQPEFSLPMALELKESLRERFPASVETGGFQIRWRP